MNHCKTKNEYVHPQKSAMHISSSCNLKSSEFPKPNPENLSASELKKTLPGFKSRCTTPEVLRWQPRVMPGQCRGEVVFVQNNLAGFFGEENCPARQAEAGRTPSRLQLPQLWPQAKALWPTGWEMMTEHLPGPFHNRRPVVRALFELVSNSAGVGPPSWVEAKRYRCAVTFGECLLFQCSMLCPFLPFLPGKPLLN